MWLLRVFNKLFFKLWLLNHEWISIRTLHWMLKLVWTLHVYQFHMIQSTVHLVCFFRCRPCERFGRKVLKIPAFVTGVNTWWITPRNSSSVFPTSLWSGSRNVEPQTCLIECHTTPSSCNRHLKKFTGYRDIASFHQGTIDWNLLPWTKRIVSKSAYHYHIIIISCKLQISYR